MNKLLALALTCATMPAVAIPFCEEVARDAYITMHVRQSGVPFDQVTCGDGNVELCEAMLKVAYMVPIHDTTEEKEIEARAYGVFWYKQCLEAVGQEI
ncbi:hypothetical protein [Vibrio phage LP.1]|nr:hypothetical protein [Vibrio phage LP.1]